MEQLLCGATASAIVALGTSATKSYAELEQNIGGIETLFGANGAKTVEEYASLVGKTTKEVEAEFNNLSEAERQVFLDAGEAYKTAGLSANEYMSLATQFSASLISSLGGDTKKAAEVSKMAIVDMADNVNKMGSSMEDVSNAYKRICKAKLHYARQS